MSDQATPDQGAENPAIDTPPGGTESQQQDTTQQAPGVNWESRYKDLQAEFTRTRQQLSDPEQQARIAQEWLSANGYALPDDDEPVDDAELFDDPNEQIRAELEQIKQELAGRTQQEQEDAQIAELERVAESKLDELGASGDGVRNWIVSRAVTLPALPGGHLDIEAAHAEFNQLLEEQQRQRMSSKSRAPYVPPGGRQATEAPDLGSHEGRVNNMLRLLHERGEQ